MIRTLPSAVEEPSQMICSLRVGGTLFGVPIASVLEIVGRPLVQPVPLAPDFLGGLTHYRGEALAVVSLRRLLGMDPALLPEDLFVLESQQGPFGLLVDSVGEVLSVSSAEHEPNPATLNGHWQILFAGAWKLPDRLLVALDPERLDPVRLAEANSRKGSNARPGA